MIRPEEFTDAERDFLATVRSQLDTQARLEFREPEQRILIAMMRRVGMREYPPLLGDAAGERAGGDCECGVCGECFQIHPFDWRVIGYGNVPFLNVLCDGRRVKL